MPHCVSRVDENGRECTGPCKEYKPWSEFYTQATGINGHLSRCKVCINAYQRPKSREYSRSLKQECMDAYGGKCACCGESELSFLTIDHVNNDGAEHRRTMVHKRGRVGHATPTGGGGYQFYLWLRREGYPQAGFQALCANCQLGKLSNGGVCPHITVT